MKGWTRTLAYRLKTYSSWWARTIVVLSFVAIISSCANYYQQHWDFNREFEKGDLQLALQTLRKNDREANSKARFIYYVNIGLLQSVLGNYTESNAAFEKAFLFGEDFRVNYLNEAASFFTNPNFTVYRGEDHEHLMLLYFKALNFLKMGNPEEALVECRRLNIRLNQLSDKYTSEEKLQRDAFIHTLMGIIYQSTQDYNNAFIAYRNAVEVYETDYARLFGMTTPEQLKKDLLFTASLTGFHEEVAHYKTKFNMPDYTPVLAEAELIFFWHNGLGPVKNEWSINFVTDHQGSNVVVFNSNDVNASFPFQLDNDKEKTDLKKVEVFRVAFPKYVERPVYFSGSTLTVDNRTYPLELSEDINKIAFYSLKQRMMLEFSKGLLRAALKKATEHGLREEDERLGAVIGLVNAMTEKADTRNWQTLPHSIYYARVPLREGSNDVTFTLKADQKDVAHDFKYQVKKGQTLFHTFSSLETTSASRYY